ncbi:MAG: Rieske 2Fe-2S domain-containing protein, partial [Ilumatobacteraceae bacterium]
MAGLRDRLTRRSVLLGGVGAAAAVCVGCGPERTLTDDSDGETDGLVELGELQTLLDQMGDVGRVFLSEARGYLVAYPADKVAAAKEIYPASVHPSLDLGVLLLSQKCPHLGCRVPECNNSGWFECPCHLSRFSGVGEYREGVSTRGMDVIPLVLLPGPRIAADTAHIEQGLATDVD